MHSFLRSLSGKCPVFCEGCIVTLDEAVKGCAGILDKTAWTVLLGHKKLSSVKGKYVFKAKLNPEGELRRTAEYSGGL
jgi:hypothetical protein